MAPTADSVGLTTKKTMSELRVIELRSELEKRGLDKTGVKAALIERLSHAIRDDGEDADTYEFEVPVDTTPSKPVAPAAAAVTKKPATKRVNKKLSHDNESETQSNDDAHEGGESDYEDEAEIETVDEEDEDEAEGGDEKVNNGEADPKGEDEELGGGDVDASSKPEKKNAAKEQQSKEDEDAGHEAEQALIVHADDNHDLDADIEEDETKEAVASTETPKATVGPKTAAAKKAAAESAKKEAAEGAKPEPKKAATPKTPKAAGKAKAGPKAAAAAAAADKEPVRNLWVSGLANTTRAADLKALFGKHGKVTSAKIVTNAKTPGARCYGFMTMSTAEEATKCIQHLHRTELHGKMISVECTRHEPGGALRKSEAKTGVAAGAAAGKAAADAKETKAPAAKVKPAAAKAAAKPKEAAEKKAAGAKDDQAEKAEDEEAAEEAAEEKEDAEEEEGEGDEEGKGKDRKRRDSKERRRSRSHSRERFVRRRFFRPFIRGFRAVRGFRRPFIRRPFFRAPFRGRMGADFREQREPFRRGEDGGSSFRARELERRQREEAFRIERERERLRVEREKLERERLELLRLEREKQRLERERIQREREELRQRKMGRAADFGGEGPGMIRRPVKRPYDDETGGVLGAGPSGRMEAGGDAFWRERKRPHMGPGRDYDRGTDRDDRRFDRSAGDFGGDREFRGSRVPRDRVPRESPPVRRMEPRFPSKEGFSGAGGAYGGGGARFGGPQAGGGGDHWSSGGRGGYSSSGVGGGSWSSEGRKPDSGHNQSWSSQPDRWSTGSGMGARGGLGGSSMGQGSQGYNSGAGGSGMMAHSGVGSGGSFGGTGNRYMGGGGVRRY